MRAHQTGAALFTAVFLIVVIAAVAAMVAHVAGTQQVTSGRSLDASRAYYAARARLDEAIEDALDSGACPTTGGGSEEDFHGLTTRVEACDPDPVDEGGTSYTVFTLSASAFRGDRTSGTLVRRVVRAQVTRF